MLTLQNEFLRLMVDERGCLRELLNHETGHNYAGGHPLWRLYLQIGDRMDVEVNAPAAAQAANQQGDRFELKWENVHLGQRMLNIAVTVQVRVEQDNTHWSIRICNDEPEVVVRECHFPLVGGLHLKPDQAFIWSKHGGECFSDVRRHLDREKLYFGCDQVFTDMQIGYPGSSAATNCYVFCDGVEGLYVACHEDSAELTQHQLRLYGDELECGMARYPHLATGESAELGPFVLSPYSGSWHTAAQKYRAWADTWFQPPDVPVWIRKLKGWQRIILKHQYGEIHYRYDQLPEIYRDGAAAGIDTHHMFGWQKGGMDNNYPAYTPDPDLGGEEALRAGIASFREAGGNVILYSNGRLIDVATDFYRNTGRRLTIKDHLGVELREFYRFRGLGTYAGNFANRTFVTACPSSEEWLDVLRGIADKAFDYGCRSVFYDQMGSGEYPCCDASHGHPVPWMNTAGAKVENLRQLREYVKRRDADMGIGIELLSDRAAQYADYIHSQRGATGPNGFIEWFRYTFPEVILTDRDIRDETDMKRKVNHCVLKGLRSDVEIYRCRRTIAETPGYSAYLAQINELRDKYADLIVAGMYRDTRGFTVDDPEVDARAFVAGSRMAVVVTRREGAGQNTVRLSAPGYHYIGYDSLGEFAVQAPPGAGTVDMTVAQHSLGIVIFEKNEAGQ